jgi:hypothetical protein
MPFGECDKGLVAWAARHPRLRATGDLAFLNIDAPISLLECCLCISWSDLRGSNYICARMKHGEQDQPLRSSL